MALDAPRRHRRHRRLQGGRGVPRAAEARARRRRGDDAVGGAVRRPVTFEAITRRPVITSQWRPG